MRGSRRRIFRGTIIRLLTELLVQRLIKMLTILNNKWSVTVTFMTNLLTTAAAHIKSWTNISSDFRH